MTTMKNQFPTLESLGSLKTSSSRKHIDLKPGHPWF
jgi:hypothetical protein